jgi:hypothetical protein
LKWPVTKRSSVSALYYDNIYATSIILLTVASLESYATRLRYFKGITTASRKFTVGNYIKHVFHDFRLVKAVTEVFVLRDVIFHNHLWEIDFSWRPVKLQRASLVKDREDKKFADVVNPTTRRTRNLRLHIVPMRVDRRDVIGMCRVPS